MKIKLADTLLLGDVCDNEEDLSKKEPLIMLPTSLYNETGDVLIDKIQLADGKWSNGVIYSVPVDFKNPEKFEVYNAMLTQLGFVAKSKINKKNEYELNYELSAKNLIQLNPYIPDFFVDFYIDGRYYHDRFAFDEKKNVNGEVVVEKTNVIDLKNKDLHSHKPFLIIDDIKYQNSKDIEKLFGQIYDKLGDTPGYIQELKSNPMYRLIYEKINQCYYRREGLPYSSHNYEFFQMLSKAYEWHEKYREIFKFDEEKPIHFLKLDIDKKLMNLYPDYTYQAPLLSSKRFNEQFTDRRINAKQVLKVLHNTNIDISRASQIITQPWLESFKFQIQSNYTGYIPYMLQLEDYKIRSEEVEKEALSHRKDQKDINERKIAQKPFVIDYINKNNIKSGDRR